MYILAENIDIATMLLLPREDIKLLIPSIGDRVRFETALSMYKSDQKVADSLTVSGWFPFLQILTWHGIFFSFKTS